MTTSPVLNALYRHQDGEAEAAAASAPALDVFELSALGRPRELEQLLDADPSLANATAVDGFTPLQLAAYFGREPAVTVLLDHGAEPDSHASNQQMVTALHAAASGGSKPIVRALLAAGADPNARQENDHTALHSAANRGDSEMVEDLVAAGAETQQADRDGLRAADHARKAGFEELANRLERLTTPT
jgi:uncharacterized protein